ncbi:bacillithiol biosynthesis deacetylase BshB1 [Carboxydochorda subterranea]|uniref:Bacillithiol biosynthesis deacetylase BshB1 n=1 Tax=Carboxydichorda subterranea TaxID=3109565 RepID=A0ABZ1BZ45_9FIRM|nr:bacillithiol biosynthesis deacetylase BshB1 [Limnochorda sp. L945t]WRP17868.1 bacillithiol biosynthesis deacetylase BshB1 [Limnochorda sp. L945t]
MLLSDPAGAPGSPPSLPIEALYGTGLDRPVDVLAVGAHPDDVELAVGGTVAAFVARGLSVGILDLTNGEPTPFGSPERRRAESHEAARILGVQTRVTLALPNRALQDTVDGRTAVASVLRLLRPKLLLGHYWEDLHPDHVAASALTDAARFYGKLTRTSMPGEPYLVPRALYFVATHLRLHAPASLAVDVSAFWEERKLPAVEAYTSQFGVNEAGRAVPERLRTRDRYYGDLIGCRYAEPLIARELAGVADPSALV